MSMKTLNKETLDAIEAEFEGMLETGNEKASLYLLAFDGDQGACRVVGTEQSLKISLLAAMKKSPAFAAIVLQTAEYYVKILSKAN